MKYFVKSRLSENISETPEGFLVCPAVSIGRTGELEYAEGESPISVGPDGIARVTRSSKEVFRPETLASFEGKPLTIGHPTDFVNPENWKQLSVGSIQNVRQGAGEQSSDLLADILITDSQAISLVKAGLREVSCGYECEWVETGVGVGLQSFIIGNHLALVEQGRAGSMYAINDHKGVKKMSKVEAIKKLFTKAQDDAIKVIDEAPEKKDDKKADDAAPPWADALSKSIDAMCAKMDGYMGGKDEEKKDDKPAADEESAVDADKEESKDDAPDDKEKSKDADPMASMDERMTKLEDAIAKLSGAGDEEKSEDEESEDDDFEESTMAGDMVGDEKARIEILAPGLKAEGKDAKRRALKIASKATDHKMLIEGLNGGKSIDLDKAKPEVIDRLFIGASEMIKIARTKDLSNWKQVRDSKARTGDAVEGSLHVPTTEELNAKYEKFYKEKGV